MPTLKCDSQTRVLFKKVKIAESRKDKDIVRDMVAVYSKSKEHKFLKKERKAFVRKRDREDKKRAKAQAKEKAEKAARNEASKTASDLRRQGWKVPPEITAAAKGKPITEKEAA